MLFSKEIESLHDDGFEGSINEHHIFKEVFFGNDHGRTSKRCLVTGVINFECDYSKQKDVFLFSNSENSVIASQVDSCNVKEDSRESFGAGRSSEGCDLLMRDDRDMNGKRIKLSVDELSDSRPQSGGILNSSAPLKGVVSRMSQPPSQFFCHAVTCRLVESSSQGVTSSCYLLKRHTETNSGSDMSDRNVKCRLPSLDGSDKKEVDASRAIASPVSQESFATKLLVTSPSATVANQSGSVPCDEERKKPSNLQELVIAKKLSNIDSMKDPRPPLRNQVQNLLRAAGWEIGRRKRGDRDNGAFIYFSPQGGSPVREFRRAWDLCGQILFASRCVVQADGKQWADMTDFWSDLYNTIIKIEKELNYTDTTASLAHRWCLLDPFTNIVFIDKKLGMLREGKVVKARRNLVIDTRTKVDAPLTLKNADSIGNQSEKHSPDWLPDSSLVWGSVVINPEGNLCVCNGESGNGVSANVGQLHDVEVKALKGGSENSDGTGTRHMEIYGNKRNRQVPSSLKACEGDSTCDHSSSCLFEVPITFGNANTTTIPPHQDGYANSLSSDRHRSYCGNGMAFEVEEHSVATDIITDTRCKKPFICSSQHQSGKKHSTFRKFNHSSHSSNKTYKSSHGSLHSELNYVNITDETSMHRKMESLDPETLRQDMKSEIPVTQCEYGHKKSVTCQLKDDDLLISAVIKNKTFRSTTKQSTRKKKTLRKRKSQSGSCRLLPTSMGKGGKHMAGKWSSFSERTVLSWLINSGVVSLNEVIQYRNIKGDAVVKDGLVTRDGILCKCCSMVLSVSEFKVHAGFKLNRPCLNLVMESGKPFTLCQLEAWSAEYKSRKSATRAVEVEEMDQNDDSCGLCGDGGELICCDSCPSTFHQACLYAQKLPEGSWYCSYCTCRICGDVVNDKEALKPPGALKCSLCEHKYHLACLKGRGTCQEVASDTWFCGESCQGVYLGLQSRIGIVNLLSDGFSWALLRCIPGDQRVHSAQRFVALKAECNSKLAVALTIMEECFLAMVDPRTGIDMIPHVLYNWGSEFARLNYHGFHTLVLEKDDVLLSVASIRIHGVTVAEMPLIATCSRYRRQGMCRRLMYAIEEMLKSFKVEKLVISAIPSLVETWIGGFGFQPLEDNERRSLIDINLMVFPGTVWLKKPMYENQTFYQQKGNTGSCPALPPSSADLIETWSCSERGPTIDFTERSDKNPPPDLVANNQDGPLPEQFSKMSCQEPVSRVGETQLEMGLGHASPPSSDDPTETGSCSERCPTVDFAESSDENPPPQEVANDQDGPLPEQFSKLSCREPVSMRADGPTETGACSEGGPTMDFTRQPDGSSPPKDATDNQNGTLLVKISCKELAPMVGVSELEMACHVESVLKNDERGLSWDEQSQKTCILQDNEK